MRKAGIRSERQTRLALKERSPQPPVPERTSPLGHESYISGTNLISGDGPAWKDVFVQLFSRHRVQPAFLVPAVAEPLIVWVVSGSAVVEERDLGGEWVANRVDIGDFFLTRSPAPYEMRWQAEGDQPFQVMHLYVSVPLFEKTVREMLGKAGGRVRLKDVSGGRDAVLSHMLSLLHGELAAQDGGSALFAEGLAQSLGRASRAPVRGGGYKATCAKCLARRKAAAGDCLYGSPA